MIFLTFSVVAFIFYFKSYIYSSYKPNNSLCFYTYAAIYYTFGNIDAAVLSNYSSYFLTSALASSIPANYGNKSSKDGYAFYYFNISYATNACYYYYSYFFYFFTD